METTQDQYLEHQFHQSYHRDCSECFNENRLIQAQRIVNNSTHAELLKKYPALKNHDNHLSNLNPLN